jgi:hypothetical protein
MEAGFSLRIAEESVRTVIDAWKKALASGDRHVEMPLGSLHVRKTPKHLYRKRIARFSFRRPQLLTSWTIYNDRYRIIWRMPEHEWLALVQELNPGVPVTAEEFRRQKRPPQQSVPSYPWLRPLPTPPHIAFVSPRSWWNVPSRTDRLRR